MTPTGNHATRRPARRRLRRPAIIAALVGLVLGLAAPAYSYWTAATMGSHAGTAAGTLPTPHLTAAPPLTPTSAGLSWSRPFDATGYELAQSPGVVAGCQANPPGSTTSCIASGLTPNTSYAWTVSAALHQWCSPATLTATTPKQSTSTAITGTTPQSAPAGSNFTATATVGDDSDYGTPAGAITFRLHPTSDCSGPASHTSAARPMTGGSATGSVQPLAGTYHWQDDYTPSDTYNTASTSKCSDPVTVTASPKPPMVTVGTTPVMVALSPDGAHL